MTERSYRALLWTLALLGATLDLSSKYAAFGWLYNDGRGGRHQVVEGVFEFTADFVREGELVRPHVNHGALFGIFKDHASRANAAFGLVSVLAAVAIISWSTRRDTAADGWLCAALGLILAGTIGNLYDRAMFGGVRDFLHFYWFEWPVFNVADCCLVGGACLLLAQAFFTPREVAAPATLATSQSVASSPS